MLNIAQLERDLEAKRQEGLTLLGKTMQAAEAEDRLWTEDETAAIEKITADGQAIQGKIARAKGTDAMRTELEKLAGSGQSAGAAAARGRVLPFKSMGQQWVEAEGMMPFFKAGGHRTSSVWRSPSVEVFDTVPGGLHATTLTTDPASGGDLIVPDYRPGILPLLFKPLVVADLLSSGTTDSNLISYMKETTFTNAAAAVAEGAAKPESALIFDATSDPVRKLAHWMPVTEEMLEDVSQIRSYIDARLRLGVQITEDDQLLNGDGVAPNILGLSKRPGLAAAYARVDPMTNAEAIYVQMMKIYWTSFLMPTGTVMHPANWAATALMKNSQGEYIAGGPFSSMITPTLWGLPVAVTPTQVANTALTGAFKVASQVFRKGGIRVEASNSHQDYFIKNLVAIRAEERLALAVYRPGAIGPVTALTGLPIPLADEPAATESTSKRKS